MNFDPEFIARVFLFLFFSREVLFFIQKPEYMHVTNLTMIKEQHADLTLIAGPNTYFLRSDNHEAAGPIVAKKTYKTNIKQTSL